MLDLGQRARTLRGVTLLPDDDGRTFHALPPSPRVTASEEGAPKIHLLRWAKDGKLYGGQLSIETELSFPSETLAAIEADLLEERRGEPLVVQPVPVTRASAELIFAGRETGSEGGLTEPLFREIGKAIPGLDSPHRARFSLVLSPSGVELVEAALRSGAAPLFVVYRLGVEAIRPAERVVARVDWKRAYEHFSSHKKEGYLLLITDVQKLFERLVEEGVVRVEVVRGLTAEDDSEAHSSIEAALAFLQREVVERLCKPVLGLSSEASRASLGTLGEILGAGEAYAVKSIEQVETLTADIDLEWSAVVLRTLVSEAHVSDLLAGSPPDAHIQDAGLGHPFFDRIAVRIHAARPLEASYIDEVTGDFAYGQAHLPVRLTASSAEATMETWANAAELFEVSSEEGAPRGSPGASRAWSVELEATLSGSSPVSPGERVRLPPQAGEGSDLTLDLAALLGLSRIALSVHPEPERLLVSRVRVRHLRGDEVLAEREVMLAAAAPEGAAVFRAAQPGDRFEAHVEHLLRDGRKVAVGPFAIDTRVFRLPPPFPGSMTIQVFGEDDWSDLDRVLVEVQKAEGEPSGVVVLDRAGASAALRLDMPDPAERGFRYRTTRTFSGGKTEQDDWIETDVPFVLAGRVAGNKLVVAITPIGPELPQAGIVLVEVELLYVDAKNQVRAEKTLVLRAIADRPTWEIAIADPTQKSYEYRVIVHRRSGDKEVGPWTKTSDLLLVVPITPA